MSEDILKALMQLFAIIAKQDSEQYGKERNYVYHFLVKQVQAKEVETYLKLFDEKVAEVRPKTRNQSDSNLTSVTDSVRILKICKRINKTLDHRQKIISTIRLLEMMAFHQTGSQRMSIVNTIAEVFNIPNNEFQNLKHQIFPQIEQLADEQQFIWIQSEEVHNDRQIFARALHGKVSILRIESANLFMVRYDGNQELLLNGLPFTQNQSFVFNPGSTLRTPGGKTIYFSDVFERFSSKLQHQKLSYQALNISYKFDTDTIGLQTLNIQEHQNSLIGIMGASGSGKSTLLHVLAGVLKPTTGNILINHIDLHQNPEKLKGIIGLVPQDDLLIENLSVFDNLYFNAKFCFKNLNEKDLREKVDHTLKSLDLFEIKDLAVGNPLNKLISGGQRKRLNIALELLREPAILFVDEPTSGLSSRDSENVMDLLRELSLKGKLIFVVIHQPSSDIYQIFDKIIVMDQGGLMIQYGNPVDIISIFKQRDGQASYDQAQCPHCGNVNSEQIFNIIHSEIIDEYGNYSQIRKKQPHDWHKFFKENWVNEDFKAEETPPQTDLNIPNRIKQIGIYLMRDFKSKWRNKSYVTIALLEAPVLAFILSYIIKFQPNENSYFFRYNENLPQYIFMSIIVALFIGLTISAEEIFMDRKIRKRESFLNLSQTSYLISKALILAAISAIQALLFILIGNVVIEIYGMWWSYWLTFFSIAFFANLLGLIISGAFDEVVTIYIIIPLLIIPQMVLGGAMFSFDKMNQNIVRIDKVPMMAELMPSKWAYEGLMVHQFKNNNFQKHFYDLEKAESNADFYQVYYVPELEKQLNKYVELLTKNGIEKDLNKTGELLFNEYQNISTKYPKLKIIELDQMTPPLLTTEQINAYTRWIAMLEAFYNQEFTMAHSKYNLKLNYFLGQQKEFYYGMRDRYHNEAIGEIVTQFYEKNKILVYENRLVQHVDAIYNDPLVESPWDIRSHLFAPKKHFFGHYYETFYFNIGIIWLMNILLFIILRLNLLRKLITLRISFNNKD